MSNVKDKPGVGNVTVRLKDVPLTQRLQGLDQALREAKTPEEAVLLMRMALDPEDYGGRIAA